ncbi:MAG: hypothetical protein WC769_06910 [Thermodesulfovibrionales bacterium]
MLKTIFVTKYAGSTTNLLLFKAIFLAPSFGRGLDSTAGYSPRKQTDADLIVFLGVHHIFLGKIVEIQADFFIEELTLLIDAGTFAVAEPLCEGRIIRLFP